MKKYLKRILAVTSLAAVTVGLFACSPAKSVVVSPTQNLTTAAASISAEDSLARYDAAGEVAAAKDRLSSAKAAAVYGAVDTQKDVISLIFTGFASSPAVNQQIVQLLKDHKRTALFLVPGIPGAEAGDVLSEMSDSGNTVGSNGLNGEKSFQELGSAAQIENLCKTNTIIKYWTNIHPDYVFFNSSEYTDALLKAASACQNTKAVKATRTVNATSFSSYEQVLSYVMGLPRGSILNVKLSGYLEETEYEAKKQPSDPAKDKQPDVEETEFKNLPESERLSQITEWILQALDATKMKNVLPEELLLYGKPVSGKTSSAVETPTINRENSGAGILEETELVLKDPVEQIYTTIPNQSGAITLTFRGIGDEQRLTEVLDFLTENEICATFFVTAADLIQYPEQVEQILSAGQLVGNGGYDQSDMTGKSLEEAKADMERCGSFLEDFGITTKIFMPIYGKYNDTLRQAASEAGYALLTYSKNPVTDETQDVATIMKYFKNGLSNGDIIFLRLDYYDKPVPLLEEIKKLADQKKRPIKSLNDMLASAEGKK